jgi:elongation factor Ts
MSAITASLVKELREKTNAGMLDCKKALEESQGNFDLAVEWLRKKGLSSAAKKAGRVAAEGLVWAGVMMSGKTGVVVEVNSETDFVARNDQFKDFVKTVGDSVAHASNVSDLGSVKYKDGPKNLTDAAKDVTATIGENIVVRRAEKYEAKGDSLVHSYIHGEGKIGVLVEVAAPAGALSNQELKNFANDVCLHIAAMNPMALSSDQIPADVVSKEKEILKAKALEQGKKPEMLDKIVEGQIRKFLAENCLLDQAFVKNPDQKISDYMKETGKKVGGDVKVKRFTRFGLGEGIEKKQTDFAAEVAAQSKGH